MRIGVVCEGPTDFYAISSFLTKSLIKRGVTPTFIDLQPSLDATSLAAGGGWSNALTWLVNNPRESRNAAYLGPGLFGGGLSSKRCDAILVQIDTDVLDEVDFANYVLKRLGKAPEIRDTPVDRFDEVQKVLLKFSGYESVEQAKSDKHIVAPAVENTECWCVNAYGQEIQGVEVVKKAALADEFLARLSASEGRRLPRSALKNKLLRKKLL